jgi:DNA modification methylase
MFYQIHHEDCLTAASHYPDGRFRLILTSTPYPGQRGFDLAVHEYFTWWRARLQVLVPLLDPVTGVLVQNVKFKRAGGWFDGRVFDLMSLYTAVGLHPIDVYMWDKLNAPPAGNHQRHDRDEWEFCFALARSEGYTFNQARRPYNPKSITSGRAKKRRPDVNGSHAHGHRDLHPDGALQGNVIRASSSGDQNRPRVKGGSFPRPLARRFIETFSNPGDWVLDPCCGAGTVLVEALAHGRPAVGMDIDETAACTAVSWMQEVTNALLRRKISDTTPGG